MRHAWFVLLLNLWSSTRTRFTSVRYSDVDWDDDLIDRHSISGYCTFVGGNLVIWYVKNKILLLNPVLRWCIELIWIQSLHCEMGAIYNKPMVMYYDNQTAMYIVNNLVFHERTKHIEADCHFIRDIVMRHHHIE